MATFRLGFLLVFLIYSLSYAQIKVKPGEVSILEVEYDKVMVAGQEYVLKVRATDKFGNPSNNFGTAGNIIIKSNGLNIERSAVSSKELLDGYFSLKIYPSKVGDYSIEAYLNEKPLSFRTRNRDEMVNSPEVSVVNGKVENVVITASDYFLLRNRDEMVNSLKVSVVNGRVENVVITAPDYFLPGYPYSVKLSFYDKEGNPVADKSHLNQTLTVLLEKISKEVSVKDIVGYQYEMAITPNSIAEFEIAVIDAGLQRKVASKVVKPEVQTIGKFEIEIPPEIEAGMPFKLRVKALDNFGRVIKLYDKIGKDVKLTSSGTGQLIPNIIPREQFRDGIAEIEVLYTKSEIMNIEASIADVREVKPVQTQLIQPQKVDKSQEAKEEKPQQRKEDVSQDRIKEEKKQVKKDQEEIQKPQKTSIKLKFPVEVGGLSRVIELNRDKNSLTVKGIFENRNPDYDIKKFENDIQINNQKVGKVSFYEDQDKNLIINVKMREEGFKITYELNPKNQLEIKIEKSK